ncbi:HU family DNA-binding protein [Parabacteroides sp. GYB001]|uniref:HU family DNA-binding protein n=1 Tax=Parabacteroides leei TaxID=2939491 RepID=UPI0020170B9A|nr:HU family DNA-binding protein [Parabacteroides leei]MCL3853718.1 HU family DNA-binding protein [Parabacteroides leei]
MSLKFGWYKTPVPGDREDKQVPHARIISQGTLDTKYMCKMISMSSTISSADVKGVLEALNFWMGFCLSEGNSIELDGLGYFTPTLKSKITTDENGKNKVQAEIDSVSFRCATSLKEQVREAGLELVKKTNTEKLPQEQRLENIMAEVEKNKCINRSACMKLNHCSQFMALNDLKQLINSNKLIQIGGGKQTMYIRSL